MDAVVVGSGPNGLAAAVTLARAGRSVRVYESAATVGGGCRTAELTLPGFRHDVCSAIHPLAMASGAFSQMGLDEHGLSWVQPEAPLVHPLDGGRAAVLERDVAETARSLGGDARRYDRLMTPLARDAPKLIHEIMGPLRPPRYPIALARFGLRGTRGVATLVRAFETDEARAIFAGMGAHGMMALDRRPTAAFSLMLGLVAHAVGWPMARGGSQSISDALAAELQSLGGEIVTSAPVTSIAELPKAKAFLFNVTPRQLVSIAGDRLPARYRRALGRYRYGPGVFKVDWALDGPVPWTSPECARGGTVHVGGTFEEIAAAEDEVARGRHPERPFVLVAQQSMFDDSRAPAGKHTIWGYCHVPNGSTVDMTARIEAQIERFAPGFRDRIIGRATKAPGDLESYNANYVGGDINGGVQDMRQLFTRPVARLVPYSTPAEDIYICSSSTPPGGGVHGMCGYWAARVALRRSLR